MTSNSNAVLIVTTDPLRNPNYGGILQAWSLYQTLKRLGYSPWVYDKRATRRGRAWQTILTLGCRVAPRKFTQRWWYCWSENQSVLEFARANMRYTSSQMQPPSTRDAPGTPFVAYITGSDQVWRPDFYDVAEKLLDFVPTSFNGPLVAYAASFGKYDLDLYDEKLRRQTEPLAKKLTSLSVREYSAIEMARSLWDVEARRISDPIFLTTQDEYRRKFDIPAEQPTLVTYILDQNEAAQSAIGYLLSNAKEYGICETIDLASPDGTGRKRTVEEWIRAIATAKYVLTDSFHGTAFAILFGRHFITFPNAERGATRFDSLFAVYHSDGRNGGLVGNLIRDPGREAAQTIENEREAGLEFLVRALNNDVD